MFLADIPSEDNLSEYYETKYRQEYKKIKEPKPKHIFRAGVDSIERLEFLKKNGFQTSSRILDVGSGIGVFVYLASKSGFQTEGIEPHQGYASYGQRMLGVKVHNATLLDSRVDLESLDCVTLHHVLEHLGNPIQALKRVRELLKKDGRLVIEVPNILSWFHSPIGQYHAAHLYYFSPWTLKAVSRLAGFNAVSLTIKPWTNHLLAVFEKSELEEALPGAEENYKLVSTKLKKHTMLRHYMTPRPYLRPFQNVSKSLGEKIQVMGKKDPKVILEPLLKE